MRAICALYRYNVISKQNLFYSDMSEEKQKKIYVITSPERIQPVKKIGIYVRISTAASRQPGSLNNQIDKLIEYVDYNVTMRQGGIYADIGSGRSVESRKDLKRLIADCKSGEIQGIVTKSVSRFGRNTADTLKLCRELKDIGVDIYFQNDNIHSLDPAGELTLSLISAVAEGSSYSKSESVKWGIEKKSHDPDAGIYSRPCYGYRRNEEGQLEIEKQEAEVVRTIFKMYLDGAGLVTIQKYLEERNISSPTGSAVWPKRTIEKMLRNEKYYGSVILYKTYTDEFPSTKRIVNNGQKKQMRVDEHHPGIITKELFDEVQVCIERRKRGSK